MKSRSTNQGAQNMKTKTYKVTFFNMAGGNLGTVEVKASTPNKAGAEALKIYTPFYWVSFHSEAA